MNRIKKQHNSLLPRQQLIEEIDRERARCDRNGQLFTLIILSLEASRIDSIAQFLQERMRLTDICGLLADDRVGILLPDTGATSAGVVVQEIRRGWTENNTVKADIFVYPSDGDEPPLTQESDDEESETQECEVRSMRPLLAQSVTPATRAMDILGAMIGLIISAPVIALTALLIKASSPGPVFFSQKRSGVGGKPFTMCKLRTMRTGAESEKAKLRQFSEQDGPAFKLTDDPRVTVIGRILRKTSIDELPQLWNVLRGDMSLVGPRPLPCDESKACKSWQKRRLDVMPGLTFIWQVEGRSKVTFDEWARMDVTYVRTRSLWIDTKLILRTIPAVLFKKGAC